MPCSNARQSWEFCRIQESWSDPGQRATQLRNRRSESQTAWMFRLWYPFLFTKKCSWAVGAWILTCVPSIAPTTLGNLAMLKNPLLSLFSSAIWFGNWRSLFESALDTLYTTRDTEALLRPTVSPTAFRKFLLHKISKQCKPVALLGYSGFLKWQGSVLQLIHLSDSV